MIAITTSNSTNVNPDARPRAQSLMATPQANYLVHCNTRYAIFVPVGSEKRSDSDELLSPESQL
jgi:hypothetical protein